MRRGPDASGNRARALAWFAGYLNASGPPFCVPRHRRDPDSDPPKRLSIWLSQRPGYWVDGSHGPFDAAGRYNSNRGAALVTPLIRRPAPFRLHVPRNARHAVNNGRKRHFRKVSSFCFGHRERDLHYWFLTRHGIFSSDRLGRTPGGFWL